MTTSTTSSQTKQTLRASVSSLWCGCGYQGRQIEVMLDHATPASVSVFASLNPETPL